MARILTLGVLAFDATASGVSLWHLLGQSDVSWGYLGVGMAAAVLPVVWQSARLLAQSLVELPERFTLTTHR